MVTMWMHLITMPHSGLYRLYQVAIVCKKDPTGLGNQSTLPTTITTSRKQVRVRNSTSSDNSKFRTSCNSRSQSSVIDAAPVADTSCWRVDPSFLTEELPGWQKVKEGAPSPSKEVNHNRKFGDNVQDCVEERPSSNSEVNSLNGSSNSEMNSLGSSSSCEDDDEVTTTTTSRSSRHEKQRSFYSRPDMIRWRLVVEGVGRTSEPDVCQHLQDVILFLESLGLDSSKMMVKFPLLSTCSVENIRAVVRFLEFHKLRRKDIVKILNNNPFLLSHSVDATFLPVVKFLLTEVGLQERHVGKVVNRCARLLTQSVDDQLRPTLRFLQTLGFNHMPIVVSNNATLLASSVENRLIPKLEFLITLGLSKEQAVQALIRFPAIFNYSIEQNLQPKFRYLVDDMGRGLDDLRAFPQFFGYSLEYRIRPRYQFLKKRNLSLPLADLLKPTDEVFYARFQHEKFVPEKEPSYVS